MTLDIAIISDTHLRHRRVRMGRGALMIHCGDMLDLFDDGPEQLDSIDAWFGAQRFDAVVCTGGNHDHAIERRVAAGDRVFANARFLSDAEWAFRGLRLYAAPWVPDLPGHAFHQPPDALRRKWAAIPAGIDVLITHTPPAGILDVSSRGRALGCPMLRAELPRIAPRVHCFGHVHASAGQRRIGDTLFVNASAMISGGRGMRDPVRIRL